MKKNIINTFAFLLMALTLSAQDINPYLVDCLILPKPLKPAEFNGTGVVALIVGNSGSDNMTYVLNQELKLTISLSYGVPNAANPLDAIGGTWAANFDWSYNEADNTFHAKQNRDIPSQIGGVSGTITILYKVTQNSRITNMNNGFAINIVPPAYAIYNNVLDDSAYEFTNVEAYDYGDAPVSYGAAVHQINIYKSGGAYENYMYLGSSVDPEPANQPSADATGDDANDSDNDAVSGENDEDGVTFPVMVAGTTVTIPVEVNLKDVPVNGAYLTAWIDWNGDGVFTMNSPEQITYFSQYFPPPWGWLTQYSLYITASGIQNLQVAIPSDAVIGTTFARFRLGANNLSSSGSATYGEVEDYQITIKAQSGDITGHLYLDVNGNGTQDSGEPNLPDIDVVITDSTNGPHTVTSDSSGDWSVNVRPGTTSVNVDQSDPDLPAGSTLTEGNDPISVTAVNGSTVDAGNHGYFIPVTIGDSVWLDDNGNGVLDAGEPGISNVVVHLLNGLGAVVTQTVTDISGAYRFSNMPPASYQVEVIPPAAYAFTIPDAAGASEMIDSNVSSDGLSPLTNIVVGVTTLTVNAGIYMPARLFGFLFIDENDSLVRDNGDDVITNAVVTLFVNGAQVRTVNTGADGDYLFENIPIGSVSVVVARVNATLVDVPLSGDAATDERRNRALPAPEDMAFVSYPITSGYGVLAANPGETLNFGFIQYPLSTQLDIRVYAAADGRVMIEISTVNENGNGAIEIYAKIDGVWTLVATVPSEDIQGFGNKTYVVEAHGLTPGESYLFKIVDESGHIFESGSIQVARSLVAVETMTLTPELITISFKTTPGLRYQVMVCESLGAPWVVEYVQSPTKKGWSALNNAPFNAGPGTSTAVRVPRNNRAKAFFKIVQVD